MKKSILLFVLICFGITGFAQPNVAQSKTSQAVVDRFAAVQTLQSSFVQEKHLALLNSPIISTGQFAFSKNPAQIRWEYMTPLQNGFLLTDGKTYRLEKGAKKLVNSALSKNIAVQMMTWLTFDLPELSKTYEVSFFDGGVELAPKEKTVGLEKITAWFSVENPQALSRIRLDEPGGDYTLLRFENTQINISLAKELF